MPSRKKAQGKARKAAKADKAKEAASLPPKNFSEITLDSWLTCCEGEDNGDGNDNESERCHHGCYLSMPKSEHDCRDFAMRFACDYLFEMCRLLTSLQSEEGILKQAAKESKDFAGTCLKENKSFIAALQDMVDKYADVFENPSKIMWAISFYHSRGAQDVIDGNMVRARFAAMCVEHLSLFSDDDSLTLSDRKLQDVMQANDKTIFTYLRKRIPCSCLDEKRHQYKGVKKMGICYNDECPLPGRLAELSSLLYCTGCKMVYYCSAGCQKVNWKYHKHQCACLAQMNSFDENFLQGNETSQFMF